ncbi:ice-structuring glycoprotein-like isoform X2 [Oncorhynchus keta]|nr:ice-structuring glycoprotein-like isoform X2 [Oncorhynchus keta]XP_052342561.1 ice-structuring glycoprotein-like isoform X2 [Oncorhynchus keta]
MTTAAPTAATTTVAATAASTAATAASTAATAAPTAAVTTPPPTVATTTNAAPAAATTTAVASTDPPSSSEGTLSLRFSLNQMFTSDLANSSSSAFKALAGTVVSELDNLFKAEFGARFIQTVVNRFRSGSIVVECTLIFNNISLVPNTSLAAQTLQTAITSNTSGLTLPVNSSSIVVTRTTTMTTAAPTAATTTVAATAASTAATAASTAATAASTAAVTTPPPTVATTTNAAPAAATTTAVASTDPPSSSEGTLSLRFSLNQMFTSDLANSSSSAFKALAGTVVSEVNKIFVNTLSFNRSIVNSFKSGSVVTNMTLVFSNKNSVPSAGSAQATFTSSSTSLNILQGSVSVESSVNSGSAPRPTAFCLSALPLTLALLMVQLLAN